MALLTPLNVNCHASDGRKVRCLKYNIPLSSFFYFTVRISEVVIIHMYTYVWLFLLASFHCNMKRCCICYWQLWHSHRAGEAWVLSLFSSTSDTESCVLNGTAALSVIKIRAYIVFCKWSWKLEIFKSYLPIFVRIFVFLLSYLAEEDLC